MRVVLILPLSLVFVVFLVWPAGHAAHWFLHVLNETAQGRKDVRVHWPSEGLFARLGLALYLLALTATTLLPAFFLVRFFRSIGNEKEMPVLLSVLLVAVVVWLLLPIVLLSVLSGRHHWAIFRWAVVRALRRQAALTAVFYAASAPLVIGCLLVSHFAVAGWTEFQEAVAFSSLAWLPDAIELWSWLFVLPLAGAFCAAALLIYARLLGRFTWLLDLTGEEEGPAPPIATTAASGKLMISHDALEPAVLAAPVSAETYGLREEEPETVIHPATPPLPPPSPRVPPSPILEIPVPVPVRRRLLTRGVFLFPWYRAGLTAWLVLTLESLFTLLLARLIVAILS